MGYFDYIDNVKLKEVKEAKYMDDYARKSMWITLAGALCFVISTALLCFLEIGAHWWLGFINIVGLAGSVVGFVVNLNTLRIAKKQKIRSYLGNLAQALHILLGLLNATVFALCIVYGFFM